MEQKTTVLWKCLYLLASSKDYLYLGEAYEPSHRGEEENPVSGRNTTVNVDKIKGFRPPYVWAKTFVFLHGLTVSQRCVVFCTFSTGTPETVIRCIYPCRSFLLPGSCRGDLCGAACLRTWIRCIWLALHSKKRVSCIQAPSLWGRTRTFLPKTFRERSQRLHSVPLFRRSA